MLIYDKSEHLTLYIWDRVAVIGGVEGDKMIEECGNAGLVSSYIKNDITRDPFHALIDWINSTIQLIEWINSTIQLISLDKTKGTVMCSKTKGSKQCSRSAINIRRYVRVKYFYFL